MKSPTILFSFFIMGSLVSCNQSQTTGTSGEGHTLKSQHHIYGKWVRQTQTGAVALNFKETGVVETDFAFDESVEVISEYELRNDTLSITDKKGDACPENGIYKVKMEAYYMGLDLIKDDCAGRIRTTMGLWIKEDHEDLFAQLDEKISNSPDPESYLNRARMYMALGKTKEARPDLDKYIGLDTTNAAAYLHRAATRFPDNDLDGIVKDCDKSLSLDPNDKNAYFLRGLALFELGEEERACKDFYKAIQMGFSILKQAEGENCAEYWQEMSQ